MLNLRSLQTRSVNAAVLRWRCNSTLQPTSPAAAQDLPPHLPTEVQANKKPALPSPSSAPSPQPSPPAPPVDTSTTTPTQGRRYRKKTPPLRPAISAVTPRKWNRALAEGVLPAYDLALKVIRTDSIRLGEEAKNLRVRIDEKEAERQTKTVPEQVLLDEELRALREKLNILQVQSEINLPDVRWKVDNAMVDLRKPVHRHLIEQKWRKDGRLDMLMERIHQMHVIPDVLPDLRPSFDLHVNVRSLSKDYHETKKFQVAVEPGSFVLSKQTLEPPKLYANVFHTDTRLYTLVLVDPDVPNEEQETFDTFLHWLKPNIPLSASVRTRILDLNTHTPYIPPHPQRGTPYHRYVLLLLPQPPLGNSTYTRNIEARAVPGKPTSIHLDIPKIEDADRLQFDVRGFAQRWGLNGSKGGGVHMWREIWDEDVSQIYADVLKVPEPRYGRPPKEDPYAEYKQSKRYV